MYLHSRMRHLYEGHFISFETSHCTFLNKPKLLILHLHILKVFSLSTYTCTNPLFALRNAPKQSSDDIDIQTLVYGFTNCTLQCISLYRLLVIQCLEQIKFTGCQVEGTMWIQNNFYAFKPLLLQECFFNFTRLGSTIIERKFMGIILAFVLCF